MGVSQVPQSNPGDGVTGFAQVSQCPSARQAKAQVSHLEAQEHESFHLEAVDVTWLHLSICKSLRTTTWTPEVPRPP